MFRYGTSEPWISEDIQRMADELGVSPRAMHWRKPLTIEEVARMAPTDEVRERRGRP